MNLASEINSELNLSESKDQNTTMQIDKIMDTCGIDKEIISLQKLGQLQGNDLAILNYIDSILQNINKKLEVD